MPIRSKMRIRYIEEPSLKFGLNQHICPKAGIVEYQPFDFNSVRPDKIIVGIIGKSEGIQKICAWLTECQAKIDGKPAKKGKKQNLSLFPPFPGFNRSSGFMCQLSYDDTFLRTINNSEIEDINKRCESLDNRIKEIADLYLNEIKYLTKNKKIDVILCVLTEDITNSITMPVIARDDEPEATAYADKDDTEEENVELEQNFRRYIKAKAMQFQVPIQIVKDRIANPSGDMQDPATIAWNFFTALYYKAGGTPWALVRKDMAETTCYAGISFYRSRDRQSIQTSIAQIFNEMGKGIILRGEEVEMSKFDRTPHLSDIQAYNLLRMSLKEYIEAIRQTPRRLVIHKTSNYSEAELYGFKQAAKEFHIQQVDLVTVMDSDIRLYREYQYPPLRGTHMELTYKQHLLYTRGAVPYFETYPGMYIPRPLQIRLFSYDESPDVICDEIVALTKMNWNNTQFDRKYPITIECAQNVGDILKYLEAEDKMQLKYAFYM